MSARLSVDGILLLDKPVGITSNRALQQIKRLFSAKKAGHTGSLDPLASGLLPLCFGEATKFSQYLLDADKRYVTTAKLGQRTTTCDAEGEVIETQSLDHIDQALINQTLKQFRGEIKQVPSMYSALKHEGKPLYQLARQGIEVERKARTIQIYELNQLDWQRDELILDVRCSKGTYIRNLVDDIGQALDCGAHVKTLRRLEAGPFKEADMVTMAELEEADNFEHYLKPTELAVQQFPEIILNQEETIAIRHGRAVDGRFKHAGLVRLFTSEHKFIGLGHVHDEGRLVAKRLLSVI